MPIVTHLCCLVMNLDLRLLAGFVGVAEELNYTRAAQRLHLTQPALTRQIHQLENFVGAPLFERTTRRVTLTEAGAALLDPARHTLRSADEGVDAARRAAHGGAELLRVGLSVSGNFDTAPRIAAAWCEQSPEVRLDLTRGSTADSIARLKRRDIDIAFVRTPLSGAEGLTHLVLVIEPLVVALGVEHPLAAHRRVHRELLAAEPLIIHLRDAGPGAYDIITSYLWPGESDPERHIADHRPDEETMVQAVAAGIGVAIVFESRARYLAIPRITYRPLTPPLHGELALTWRADDPNPLIPAFTAIALEVTKPAST